MARTLNRLVAKGIEKQKAPGYYADGGNLYFRVAGADARGWVFRYVSPTRVYPATDKNGQPHKRAGQPQAREMGLGSFDTVTLAMARVAADECRRHLTAGIDPIDQREQQREAERVEAAKTMTFDACRKTYITAHEPSWRNAKHRQQWTNTLETYATPVFGDLPVQAVDTAMVLKVIEPIWATKPETAGRVRGRIETILDWAKAREMRTGENPARWRGHLQHILPTKSKIRKVKHHPALPYNQIGAFVADLHLREGIAAQALRFTILCAVRTGDIIGNDREDKPPMKWPHVDFQHRVWTIPSTKNGSEHRVPLSADAVELLKEMKACDLGEIVFPGASLDAPMSNMSMASVIERMNDDRQAARLARYMDPKQDGRDVTVHGFRSSFRDWAAERTSFPREIAEAALAHTINSETEAAYQRGDMLDKRRKLMDAWAAYCAQPEAAGTNVVPMTRTKAG
jgi:integrase